MRGINIELIQVRIAAHSGYQGKSDWAIPNIGGHPQPGSFYPLTQCFERGRNARQLFSKSVCGEERICRIFDLGQGAEVLKFGAADAIWSRQLNMRLFSSEVVEIILDVGEPQYDNILRPDR